MNKEEIQAIERCENFSINVLVEHPDIYGSRWLVQEDIKSIKAVKTLLRLYRQLEQENKELHNKIDKAIEYMNGEEFFLLMNSVQTPDKAVCEDYFKAKGNLLKILKDSDVDE